MNRIEVNFLPCDPAPSKGYNIQWRVQDSGDAYTDAGYFFVSPAVFYDTVNPMGTCYEGFIVTDCNSSMGNQVNWTFCDESGESGESGTNDRTLTFSLLGGGVRNISAAFNLPVDVDLDIDSVFVDGYLSVDCTGSVSAHLHSTVESIAAGSTSYIGADVTTGTWLTAMSFVFYGIGLSWPGNSSVLIHNGDVVIMGSYSVSIIIDGC